MDLRELIKGFEGLRLKPYLCPAGRLTVGYGRNLDDRGISESEALYLLENDIAACLHEAVSHFPWFGGLSPARQDVLVSMLFQLGYPGLAKFKRMLHACESGDFRAASEEMLSSQWAIQTPERARILSEMMGAGVYPEKVGA